MPGLQSAPIAEALTFTPDADRVVERVPQPSVPALHMHPPRYLPLYLAHEGQRALADFDQDTRTYLLKQGRLLLKNHEYRLGHVLARRILELDSHDLGGLELLCEAMIAQGDMIHAAIAARERLKASEDATSYLLLAKIAYHDSNDDEARFSLAKALELVDQDCEPLFEIYKLFGNASLRQGDHDAAEEYYHRAFRLQPSSDLILVNLGTLEIQRQCWSNARMRFQEAVAKNPKNEKAWVGLALVNREQKDIELSWGNLERALDLKSDNLTALQLCVTWALSDGYWQRAAHYLENYLCVHTEDADIAYSLSCIYFHTRRLRDADLALERVRILMPQREGLPELDTLIRQALQMEKT